MGTNYYFINKNNRKITEKKNEKINNEIKKFQRAIEDIGCTNVEGKMDTLRWHLEIEDESIHIGKKSYGWNPLFSSGDYFSSMHELKQWYIDNQDFYIIEDEYGKQFTWKEFYNEMIVKRGAGSIMDYGYSYHYLDEDGYEWSTQEFS